MSVVRCAAGDPPGTFELHDSTFSGGVTVSLCLAIRDPHRRRPIQRRAVSVHRRPIGNGVARAAMPTGVPATAVAKAGDVSDEDLVRAESVTIRTPRRQAGDPLAVGRLHQLT
jgi:hypothetical protein